MKKLLKVFASAFLVMSMTGCMKVNMGLEVKKDKSMAMEMKMLVNEEQMKALDENFTVDDLSDQFKEEANIPEDMEMTSEKIEETIDGVKWVGVVAKVDIPKDKVNDKLIEKDGKITLTLPVDTLFSTSDMGDMDAASVSMAKGMGCEVTLKITMPGKAESNLGTVDGRTVTIDLLDLCTKTDNPENLVVSSPLSNTSMMSYICIGAGAVLIIAGFGMIIMKKNSKKKYENIVPESLGEASDEETQSVDTEE